MILTITNRRYFFLFDDKLATYTVTRENGLYQLKYETTSDRNKDFGNIQIIIGKSKIDLQSLIGKKVIIDGEFVYAKKQCIIDKCIDIGTYATLDIKSIHQAN